MERLDGEERRGEEASEREREGSVERVTGNDSGYKLWPLERSHRHDGGGSR